MEMQPGASENDPLRPLKEGIGTDQPGKDIGPYEPETEFAVKPGQQTAMMARKDPIAGRPRGEGGGGSSLPMANPSASRWAQQEITILRNMHKEGKSASEIAEALKGKSPSSIYNKLDSMGLSKSQAPIFGGE